MYKLLIVDDDTLIRRGLKKMIDWDDVEFAGEAYNGETAMEIVKTKDVDIVLTDIRMPESNGIELLEQIYKFNPNIETIVISAYDEFEYAKYAIKYGSINYILKPISPKELNNSIKKAKENIDNRIKQKSQNRDNDVSNLLQKVLKGYIADNSNEYAILGQIDLKKDHFCVCVINNFDENYLHLQPELHKEILTKFKIIYTLRYGDKYVIIFCDIKNNDYMQFKIYDVIQKILSHKKCKMSNCTCGIGKVFVGLKKVYMSYENALEALPYTLFEDDGQVVRYSDIEKRKHLYIDTTKYEKELQVYIALGNKTEVEKIINEILSKINNKMSIGSLRVLITNLCSILLKSNTDLSKDINDFLQKINSTDYLLAFNSITSIKKIIYNIFLMTTEKCLEENGGKDALISKVKDFIDQNYSQSIGLKKIADLFHVNNSYLSDLFKKTTGENINAYITCVRIQNAKKLLENEELNVSTVGEIVGYSNDVYFYKVFKRTIGMTPKEYRTYKKGLKNCR
ncbi:MAG: response regulator [Firmicutes bacterium]|nr:response regulator [Bacillota bacterium]